MAWRDGGPIRDIDPRQWPGPTDLTLEDMFASMLVTPPPEVSRCCAHAEGGPHLKNCSQRCWDCRGDPDGPNACRCARDIGSTIHRAVRRMAGETPPSDPRREDGS